MLLTNPHDSVNNLEQLASELDVTCDYFLHEFAVKSKENYPVRRSSILNEF